MPVIEVTVSPRGEIQIETRGFAGPRCQQATQSLEAALGVVRSETLTAAYYASLSQPTPLVVQPDTAE